MLSYQTKSNSSMSGYGKDVEDVEDEMTEKRVEHNLEPCVVIMNKVETESDKRISATTDLFTISNILHNLLIKGEQANIKK